MNIQNYIAKRFQHAGQRLADRPESHDTDGTADGFVYHKLLPVSGFH